MAGHAGRSPPFRFADAWLARRGAPLRRHGPPRAGPRAGRADRLAQRPGKAVPAGGGEGAARPGGAAGAGASAAPRRSRPGRRSRGPGRGRPRHRGGPPPGGPRPGPARSRPVPWAARPDGGCGRRWWSAAIPLAGRARPAPGCASGSARSATASPAGPASGPRPGGWRPGTRGPDGPPGPAPPAPGGWSAATASSRCPASGRTVSRRRSCAWRRRGWRTAGRPGIRVRPVASCTHVGPEHSGYRHHRAGWTVAGRSRSPCATVGRTRAGCATTNAADAASHAVPEPSGAAAGPSPSTG